jgi:predicted transcriptional regulator
MENTTIKVSKEINASIRLIAAITGEKQYRVIERLIKEELKKYDYRNRNNIS